MSSSFQAYDKPSQDEILQDGLRKRNKAGKARVVRARKSNSMPQSTINLRDRGSKLTIAEEDKRNYWARPIADDEIWFDE
jgi:hypothetical protein